MSVFLFCLYPKRKLFSLLPGGVTLCWFIHWNLKGRLVVAITENRWSWNQQIIISLQMREIYNQCITVYNIKNLPLHILKTTVLSVTYHSWIEASFGDCDTHLKGWYKIYTWRPSYKIPHRNNICWRIRDSDLSLLPWSWRLCVFVEQLCLVASRQVSRHLEGRSACHAPSQPPSTAASSRFCSVSSVPPLLLSAPCWVSMSFRPNKQTNRTTEKPITRTRSGWAWGERWGWLLFALWASSISLWWQKRPPRTLLPTLVFDFQRGSRWSSLFTDTSSSDPIHSWLQPQACSLYLGWSCTR